MEGVDPEELRPVPLAVFVDAADGDAAVAKMRHDAAEQARAATLVSVKAAWQALNRRKHGSSAAVDGSDDAAGTIRGGAQSPRLLGGGGGLQSARRNTASSARATSLGTARSITDVLLAAPLASDRPASASSSSRADAPSPSSPAAAAPLSARGGTAPSSPPSINSGALGAEQKRAAAAARKQQAELAALVSTEIEAARLRAQEDARTAAEVAAKAVRAMPSTEPSHLASTTPPVPSMSL